MKSHWITLAPVCLAAFALLNSASAHAQLDRQGLSISPQAGTSNFRFAEPNELTIVVSIIGAVRNPGRYEISRSINLLDAISLAGGWSAGSALDDIVITRVISAGVAVERKEIHLDLEDLTKLHENQLTLQQGDIILVPSASAITFDDILRYAVALGVLVTTVIAVSNN